MPRWFRLTIITLTVGGGFAGMVAILQSVSTTGIHSMPALLFLLAFFALYAFVLAAGLLFANDTERTTPLLIAFSLQIPSISSPILGYSFGAGMRVTIGLLAGNPRCTFRLGSDFAGSILQRHPWGAGVNIVAVGMLVALLWRVRSPTAGMNIPRDRVSAAFQQERS